MACYCTAMTSASALFFSPALSNYWYVCPMSATSSMWWWYMPCRALWELNSPHIVRCFHVLTLVTCIISNDQDIIPAGYLITGRAYVLITWLLCFSVSWLFRTYLTFCTCLAVAGLRAAYSWLPFACGISRYLHLPWTSAMLPFSFDHLLSPRSHPPTH